MDESVRFRLDPDSKQYEAQVSPEELEKFAELIVRECISALDEKIYRSIDGDGDEIWADLILKEHFGVEE
jgi:hypothetical protein